MAPETPRNDVPAVDLPPEEQQELRHLHEKYRRFMADLFASCPETLSSQPRSFERFVAWWDTLSPEDRKRLSDDYERGFAAAVERDRATISRISVA